MAPNVTNITLVDSTTVKISWDLLPDDIDIYNSYILNGYKLYIFPMFPSLAVPEGSLNITQTINSKIVSSLDHSNVDNPMMPYKFSIWAFNDYIGENVKNEYCFAFGRTGLLRFLFFFLHATFSNNYS